MQPPEQKFLAQPRDWQYTLGAMGAYIYENRGLVWHLSIPCPGQVILRAVLWSLGDSTVW
jgi:hypothetical protein